MKINSELSAGFLRRRQKKEKKKKSGTGADEDGDSHYDAGEPFVDTNNNGVFDAAWLAGFSSGRPATGAATNTKRPCARRLVTQPLPPLPIWQGVQQRASDSMPVILRLL